MIQFQILSGKQAGNTIVVRRFPIGIGRGPDSDLPLDDAGVWSQHLTIDFDRNEGFAFSRSSEGTVVINDEPVEQGMLRNGDTIKLGTTLIRFWLAPSRQKSMNWREVLTWVSLLSLFLLQAALIRWLRD